MLVWSILSLAALVVSSPLPSLDDYSTAIESRQSSVRVSQENFNNLRYYVQHSGAAYCNSERGAGTNVVCKGQCNDVKATIVSSFVGRGTGIGGYVSVDHTRREIVMSIRGSNNIRNFITDIVFLWRGCDFASDCKVHAGFAAAWDEISRPATDAVRKASTANPGYKFVATGHSLGGAVATLGAAYMRRQGFAMDIYSYGAPRVGNDKFANFVTSQAGSEHRITHTADPVPRLPPIIFGYRHSTPEFWLATGGSTTTNYQVGDIRVCNGIANTGCNGGTFGLDIIAHLYYLGPISGCAGFPLQWKRDLPTSPAQQRRDAASDKELLDRLNTWSKQDQDFTRASKVKRDNPSDQELTDRLNQWSKQDQELAGSL